MRHACRLALALLLASLAPGCGAPAGTDGGAGGAGGSGGTGGAAGAGGSGGAAGAPLTFLGPTAPRRGPIALAFALDESGGALSNLGLALDGGRAATVWAAERDGGALTLVWSSFDDSADDGVVALSLTAQRAGQPISLGFGVDLRNAPATARLVAVAHPLAPRDGGGASSDHTEVSIFAWDGGALAGAPRRLTVGRGPSSLPAAPHGRAFAVVEDAAGTASLVRTPLSADPALASVLPLPALPFGQVADAQFSRDGRTLFVLGTQGAAAGQDATLWAIPLAEDLSAAFAPRALAALARPPLKLDVDRSTGRVLVAVGQGPASGAQPRLLWFEADGTAIGLPYDFDFSVANDLAVAPGGGLALSTSNIFGDELFLYTLGALGPAHVQTSAAAGVPYHVAFHPDSTPTRACALVTNLNQNRATPVLVTPSGLTPLAPSGAISLAAELDVVERGPHAGTAFVSSVARVAKVRFSLDGGIGPPSAVIDFGAGTTNITGAIGVQR